VPAAPALGARALAGPELGQALRRLGVGRVEVHYLVGFGAEAPSRIGALIETLELPYRVTVHDYLAICPRINFVDLSGRYCGEPGLAGCQRCLLARREGQALSI